MNKKNMPPNNKEQTVTRTSLTNLEPGNSVDEHRKIETANIILASDEMTQQNENL